MRINLCLFLTLLLCSAAPGQEVTNTPAAELQSSNTPATSSTAHSATPTNASPRRSNTVPELRSVPLVAGPATVIASNVNIRGKAGLKGEVLGKVTKGDQVTVIEEVTLKKSAPDEPSAWAKILLPPSIHAWVN